MGWRTGTNNPAENFAAKKVMKDYTAGKLLYCMRRPDFNPDLHKQVKTSGFNLDMTAAELTQQASAQNYEEIKQVDISVSSQVTTNLEEEEQKIANITTAVPQSVPQQKAKMHPDVFKIAESEFDA